MNPKRRIDASDITVRAATTDDLGVLLALAEMFMAESDHGVTFDMDASADSFERYIADEQGDVLVGCLFGVPLSLAIVAEDRDWHREAFGYLVKFYVSPYGRGSAMGRKLARAVADWFDARGCIASYATATAGIGQDKQFINLLAKAGFAPAGPTLVRA